MSVCHDFEIFIRTPSCLESFYEINLKPREEFTSEEAENNQADNKKNEF